jgi:chloramphenicol 3-O-phosphotransferase
LAHVVTRRNLLEWNPSSEVDRELSRRDRNSLAASFRTMWVGPLMAVGLALYLSAFAPTALARGRARSAAVVRFAVDGMVDQSAAGAP